MADPREAQFQQDIVDAMAAGGWLVGRSEGYDRARALYAEDVVGYYREAHPDQWERFCKRNERDPESALLDKVARELDKAGTLNVLRHGFKVPGARVSLCTFKPDHGMNEDTLARYRANRLRVVPEVSYSPHARTGEYNPRLDLVLFVNGIPTATLELKSEFKQALERAQRQYRRDRPVRAPTNRKPEPLLTFKRGALVHFAVSQAQVAMATKLAGNNTVFLPFDQGTPDGGAGNPPPASEDDYATGYLWDEVFAPDNWLKILGRFLHLEVKSEQDFHGKWHKKETMIFPRYHQWDVVNKLLDATRGDGPGKRYLVQHSAGSGKSNSIAWTAHQLAALYDDDGNKRFDSVVVVTDRTVLDDQLQDTIYQFEHATGVVQPISRDEGGRSKRDQLAAALEARTRIIVVTIQTFPALFEALDQHPDLKAGTYAVIADEAHSSQTGQAAAKLKALLGVDRPEGEDLSAEELLDAAVAARKPSETISYYAFTATPKGKTLELFGTRPDPERPPAEDNKPVPFHVYSMRQAIEEGFILDVLHNYVTYKTAFRLAHPDADDQEVDARRASTRIARWVRLHPYNIEQKVEVIVEHFREKVYPLLDKQAKAMVVTGSRQEAVRYQLAMRSYIDEKNYDSVHPLVAFSGSVPADEYIPAEVTETSGELNPGLKGRDHREAFNTGDFNVMIVANKFQTGFDQPRLCAMYVDRKLQGVDCVQTLSRLNRRFPGKEAPFVLDFVNDAEDVRASFEPYYNTAELTDVSDPDIVFDLQRKLNEARVYEWHQVESFFRAFHDKKASNSTLSYYTAPAVERFRKRYHDALADLRHWQAEKRRAEENGNRDGRQRAEHELAEAGERRDALDLFRRDLQSFYRTYEFLAQIVDYDDRELEALCVFARHLHPLLRTERLDDEDLDLSELDLTHYRLNKQNEQSIRLGEEQGEYGLDPVSEVGSGKPKDPKKERLAEIIERLNDLFGTEVDDRDQLQFADNLADRMSRDEGVVDQIRSHTPEQVMHGRFPRLLEQIVLDAMSDHEELATKALETDNNLNGLAWAVLRLMAERDGTARVGGVD
ncbi:MULTISPECIES: type I restriction endonuclease subunit R [unclassified Wenzhouxiangella]|uniref:type I restriction endonuclease subunit R n=1 Tax=unclassified Wenzhouxiangella TaxID=2613841 RepID=UPI0015F29D37|nr:MULTISPECIES: type I restriction endonuclease [unclassified Wenzhouxiangella]